MSLVGTTGTTSIWARHYRAVYIDATRVLVGVFLCWHFADHFVHLRPLMETGLGDFTV